MGKKKCKMTRAQAAAARRDDKPRAQTPAVHVKDDGPRDRGNRFVVGVTIAMVALIVVLSAVFAIGPISMGG